MVGGSGLDLKVLWRCRSTPPSFHPSPPFLPSSLLHSENLAERYIEDQGSVGRAQNIIIKFTVVQFRTVTTLLQSTKQLKFRLSFAPHFPS
jgi:hypothetical protein